MRINQFEDVFDLDNDFVMKVDYLKGAYEFAKKSLVKNFYDDSYETFEEIAENLITLNQDTLTIVLIPTYYCNMNCVYCYEGAITFDSSRLVPELIPLIHDKILELANRKNANFIEFILLSGEPIEKSNMIWFENFFYEFKLRDMPYDVSCISNGLEIVNLWDSIERIGISHFQLTLDGSENTHNTRRKAKDRKKNGFENLIDASKLILKNEKSLVIRINTDESNYTEIENILDRFIKEDWTIKDNFSFYVYPVTMSGMTSENNYLSEVELLDTILDYIQMLSIEYREIINLDFHGLDFVNKLLTNDMFIPKLNFCNSSTSQFVFDAHGNIYTCWWGVSKQDFIVGNLNKINYSRVEKWEEHNVKTVEKCSECKYKYICGSGCAFKAAENNGSSFSGNCSDFYQIIQSYLKKNIYSDDRLCEVSPTVEKLSNYKLNLLKEIIDKLDIISLDCFGNSISSINSSEVNIKKISVNELRVNDVILYQKKEGFLVLHQIVCILDDDLLVKGDNELYIERISSESVIGIYTDENPSDFDTDVFTKEVASCLVKIDIDRNKIMEVSVENV